MKFVQQNEDNYSLVFSTYLGGYDSDGATNLGIDRYGHVYLTGSTQSRDFTWTPQYDGFPVLNAYQSTHGGGSDAFLSKIDPENSALLYSTYLGGNGNDNAAVQLGGIAVTRDGMAYVTGTAGSANFPIRDAYDAEWNGYEVFVTIINASQIGDASLVSSTFSAAWGLIMGMTLRWIGRATSM